MKTAKELAKKEQAINALMTGIKKKHGKDICHRGSEKFLESVPILPTPFKSLNDALGVDGLPRGRIIEISGESGDGKTSLCYQIAALEQSKGNVFSLIDAEHASESKWMNKCGVNVEKTLIAQPDYAEQALDILETQVRSGVVDLMVVDSVAALVPKAEIEGEMGDLNVALQARLLSQAMRKLTAAVSKTKSTVIFINQLRSKIGRVFGDPNTTPGGRALKFYSSVRMDVRGIGREYRTVKGVKRCIAHKVRIKITKNKLAPCHTEAILYFVYNHGMMEPKEFEKLFKKRGKK